MTRYATSTAPVILSWLHGMFRTRAWRMTGTIAGIAITVALIASFSVFLKASEASMTSRAIAGVPVDWQVELVPGTEPSVAQSALDAAATIGRRELVGYATVDGLEADAGGSVQVTGAGKVVGLAPSYIGTFPPQIRLLQGTVDGALVAQQTAANLHVGVGDTVLIHRPGLEPASVKLSGVVDLPNADALFQAIGVPAGAAPQAPPDNVLILPFEVWQGLFGPQALKRPDTVRQQIHASLDRQVLPADPLAAWQAVTAGGHNLELRLAGQAILGNNIAARLDGARADALYSRILFLFLGAPGVALAGLLTIAVALSGEGARQRDQAILRQRGAPRSTMMLLAGAEAGAVWLAGAPIGLCLASVISVSMLDTSMLKADSLPVLALAALAGLVLACGAILVPAWLKARSLTVIGARQAVGEERIPIWRRIYLDFILLGLAAIVFWRTAASGYQVVLATEGVSSTAIDYWSFLAPVLLWLGIGLLTVRLVWLLAGRGRPIVAALWRPVAGTLAGVVAASLSRQRGRLAMGVGLTALAFAFAASTAIFNTTYQNQAQVDARLTNGADVAVTGDASVPAGDVMSRIAAVPGVAAMQPMQHRFAYVGADLQDLYGIDAARIGEATTVSDAFFAGNDAKKTLELLASTPDGVLVSEETVTDFQLTPGDTINLRLRSQTTHDFATVPFTFIGIAREFPTAPHDSFLVANASYVARMTGQAAAEIVLIKANIEPPALRGALEAALKDKPGLHTSDVNQAAHLIGSSLTAVNLRGLTQLELAFAILAVIASAGLILALGLADRRRTFAILVLLGATGRQTAAFLWAEATLIFVPGAVIGLAAGTAIAWMLVTVLTGVFDPPPEMIAIPWIYLGATVIAALVSTALAVEFARRNAAATPIMTIKEMR